MIYLPPDTVKEKVAALRACLPGVNLYNFLKGMPTALARSKETVPRGMSQLKEVSRRSSSVDATCYCFHVAQLPPSADGDGDRWCCRENTCSAVWCRRAA